MPCVSVSTVSNIYIYVFSRPKVKENEENMGADADELEKHVGML